MFSAFREIYFYGCAWAILLSLLDLFFQNYDLLLICHDLVVMQTSNLPFPRVRVLEHVKVKSMKMELTIAQPDDWHLHLRDGDLLEAVVPHRLISSIHLSVSLFTTRLYLIIFSFVMTNSFSQSSFLLLWKSYLLI